MYYSTTAFSETLLSDERHMHGVLKSVSVQNQDNLLGT
jgi:hypothetical protein